MAVSPAMTFNAKGNLQSNQTITASGTLSTTVDGSAKFETEIAIEVVFGTVAATSGIQVDVFRNFGSGPTTDTISILTFVIPSTASTTKDQSFSLGPGKYSVKLTNLDGTNSVTGVYVTSTTWDSIG